MLDVEMDRVVNSFHLILKKWLQQTLVPHKLQLQIQWIILPTLNFCNWLFINYIFVLSIQILNASELVLLRKFLLKMDQLKLLVLAKLAIGLIYPHFLKKPIGCCAQMEYWLYQDIHFLNLPIQLEQKNYKVPLIW